MPLIGPKLLFERAYKEGYAVGAFNVNNMEIIQGIIEAATEEQSPAILQVSAGARTRKVAARKSVRRQPA